MSNRGETPDRTGLLMVWGDVVDVLQLTQMYPVGEVSRDLGFTHGLVACWRGKMRCHETQPT